MDNSKKQDSDSDSYLFILLGWDTLYSLNLNKLLFEKAAKLELVFSHFTKQPDNSDYPLGMGLFVEGSKLHFFGGENLVDCEPRDRDNINIPHIGLPNKRPNRPSKPSSTDFLDQWFNKKFFSFNISQDNSNRYGSLCITPIEDTSTKVLPNHLGYKVRPVMATILGKLYALTTRPYSTRRPAAYGYGGEDQILFEVFDPNNGKWEDLTTPDGLYKVLVGFGDDFTPPMIHCVNKEKLLLQTYAGQYLYNANSKQWIPMPEYSCPIILATLEWNNFLLALVKFESSYEVVVYDLETFDLETFWKESNNYIYILDILEGKEYSCIEEASFSRVNNNLICLVLNNICKLNVYLFEVTIKPTLHEFLRRPLTWLRDDSKCAQKVNLHAHVLVHQIFDRPDLLYGACIFKTFIFPEPREENAFAWESYRGCSGSKTVFLSGLPSSASSFAIWYYFCEFGEIKPMGVYLNRKEHFAFVEFEYVESTYKSIKASPILLGGNKVCIDKVYRAGQSRRMWWRKQKKAFSNFKLSRMEEIVAQFDLLY